MTKTQKLKKRNKKEKKLSVEDVTDAAINEEEFIITSKSKAHKKIKIDPKNAFGGNILRPRFGSFFVCKINPSVTCERWFSMCCI